MFVKRQILFIIIFFLCWNISRSQIIVNIPDATIGRGRVDTISIYGSFDNISFNSLKLVLQFNAYLLDIKKVIGNRDYIIAEDEPNFDIQLNKIEDATLSISSSNINLSKNGETLICKLWVEGLVYKDSLDTIKLVSMELDGNPVDFTYNGGVIKVVGPSVFPVKENYFSNSFPLPTDTRVFFRFGIVTPSFVEFTVYNSKGEEVLSSKANSSFFKVKGNKGETSLNGKLDEGDYLLEVTLPLDLASGSYFLQLNAFSIGVFYSSFLVVK